VQLLILTDSLTLFFFSTKPVKIGIENLQEFYSTASASACKISLFSIKQMQFY